MKKETTTSSNILPTFHHLPYFQKKEICTSESINSWSNSSKVGFLFAIAWENPRDEAGGTESYASILGITCGITRGITRKGVSRLVMGSAFLTLKKTTGWWFGCHEFGIFPLILGISSSQLTNSYFSEGWPNHYNSQ